MRFSLRRDTSADWLLIRRIFAAVKNLRDIYIHQTHAVVEIFPGDDGSNPLLVTTRWDEGLIPGEFISSEFSNPDVVAFCDYLVQAKLAVCRNAS